MLCPVVNEIFYKPLHENHSRFNLYDILLARDTPRKPGNDHFRSEFHLGMGLLVPNSKWLKSIPGHVFIFDRKIVCIWIITQIHFDDEQGDEQYWISSQT